VIPSNSATFRCHSKSLHPRETPFSASGTLESPIPLRFWPKGFSITASLLSHLIPSVSGAQGSQLKSPKSRFLTPTVPIIGIMGPVQMDKNRHVTAFYFCNFFKRPSRGPNRESLGGERAGERGAVLCLLPSGSTLRASPPARCRFLLKDRPSEEHSSRIHRGKEKVSFLRTGSLAPLQLAAKDERAELHLGRSPAGKKSLIAARAGARRSAEARSLHC